MQFCSGWVSISAALWSIPAAAGAQWTEAPAGIRSPHLGEARAPHPAWLSTVSSALVPGTGQLLRHQDRGVVYLIAEVFFLERFISLSNQARRNETRYRDLAFQVARASYSPTQQDTVFEYFEQMGVFVESGPFDADPGPGFIPAADEDSYNGRIWALARKTYFANPDVSPDTASAEYRAAAAFYRRRAVGPNFRWSWRGALLQQDLYRQSIVLGDDAFRRASEQLGLVLANHFLSMVDAFVSQRLARKGTPVELGHQLRGGRGVALRLDIGVRVYP